MVDIYSVIEEYTKEEDVTEWDGTLREYLQMVLEKPYLNELAHSRICRMIESKGIEFDGDDKFEKVPKYNFFKGKLFGIDEELAKIIQYFQAASHQSEISRRILLIWGPTSSAKSDFVTMLKRGLEQFSKTKEGALYGIRGCPLKENPLNAIPFAVRDRLRDKFKLDIKGELCPACAQRLKDEFGRDFWNIPVERIFISEAERIGIGTFSPSDPKTQSQSELVGSLDYSKLEKYGVESDVRAFRFDGEIECSSRGLFESIEMLKVDPKFLHIFLTLAQEKRIKIERFPLIWCDNCIVAHTNEQEFNGFLANKKLEALQDRLWVAKLGYNLKVDEEVKIYKKLLNSDIGTKDVHIAPHSLDIAAMFAVLSRLEEPKNKSITLLQKMRLYNGELVDGFSKETIKELREESDREGLDGISPRFIVNRLASCFTKHNIESITPISTIRSIKDGLESNAKLSKEDISKLEDIITICIEEYGKLATNDVQKAFFVNFEHEIQVLLSNYLDSVEAYLDDSKVVNEFGDPVPPNERLMRGVEEKVEVTSSGKDSFREEVYRKMIKSKTEKGEYDYKSHPKLKEALQKQLFEERKDVIKLTISTRNPDAEALERLNIVVETLVKQHGYNHDSANELLKFVSNLING